MGTMKPTLFALLLALGCTKAPPNETPSTPPVTEPAVAPVPTTPPAPTAAATTVELTAVTLADDCGGTAPWAAPAKPDPAAKEKADRKSEIAPPAQKSMAKRRCEQTSMQLSISGPAAGDVKVTSVELFDDANKSLGKLAWSKPTKWSESSATYEVWDGKVAAAPVDVSYVLEQPKWDTIGDRWNRTFTLKAVVTVGGVATNAQKTVTLTAPASLPPGVKT